MQRLTARPSAARCVAIAATLLLACAKPVAVPTPVVIAPPSEPEPGPEPLPPRAPMRIAEATSDGLETKCRPERRRACLQAKAYPDEPLEWELSVQPRCEARDCPVGTAEPELVAVVADLLAHGGHGLFISGRSVVVAAELSHDDVLAAARSRHVVSVDVHCRSGSGFCSCADLPTHRCEEHAFCRPVLARAIRGHCISDQLEVVGCTPADVGCSQAETEVAAPDGALWRVSDSCIPSAPGWGSVRPVNRPLCNDR